MKVLLINPRATYCGEISQKCYPPVSLLYLAASLRQAGHEPHVLDANAFGLSDETVFAEIQKISPDLTGISVYSEILPQVYCLADLAKKAAPQCKLILGGPHATAVPKECLDQFPKADFILTGEAEDSLPMLCQAIETGDRLEAIPGLYFRKEGAIVQGPKHVFPDVHAIPWPAKDLAARAYEKKRYHSLLVRKRPVDTLFTSRGCPFSCGFCYNFRKHYRARKPEDVVQELAAIRDRGIRDVEICDDTFTVNEDRALAIFDLIVKERLDISFRIKSRVDVFTEKLAKAGKKAGVYLVAFGMESGSQKILDAMNKKITLAQSAEACRLTKKYGIAAHSSWVIGYPGETPDTVEDTVRFILKNKPATANLAVLRPYPNTPAYEIAKESGDLMGQWSPHASDMPWVRLPWAQDKKILDDLCTRSIKRIYFTPYYTAAFARRMITGANWTLFAYAVQEAQKVLGLKRKENKE
ncbi:Radical SAM domain protein [Desulfatibacillum aliphaticivorans]|uniref:Radical SAM domain protein n=1 Tax=Desulfatibacillum aliphaticivorans TaxID=218208 RepID=B8FF38_DESAL|nr:radical SAM protein [Desulfatibacillum aliphaticivorans]ACL03855.1 Radical SAM domain protein [Desulfatibacillum aliphaticivorans]